MDSPKNDRLPGPMVFDGNIAENWRLFHQEFEIYILSTEIYKKPEKVQTATLLRCMGRHALQVFNTFQFESDDEKSNYKIVCDKFKQYCEPKKNLFYERHFFNSRFQALDEPFDKFLTDLKSKASRCGYGDLTEDLIKDRIIAGIHSEELKAKLLKFNYDDVNLNKLVDECRAYETSLNQLKQIENKNDTNNVNKVSKNSSTSASRQTRPNRECKFCGLSHEFKKELCPAYGKKCRRCQRNGHFEKKCSQATFNSVPNHRRTFSSSSNFKKSDFPSSRGQMPSNRTRHSVKNLDEKTVQYDVQDEYLDQDCNLNNYFIGSLNSVNCKLQNKEDVKMKI